MRARMDPSLSCRMRCVSLAVDMDHARRRGKTPARRRAGALRQTLAIRPFAGSEGWVMCDRPKAKELLAFKLYILGVTSRKQIPRPGRAPVLNPGPPTPASEA